MFEGLWYAALYGFLLAFAVGPVFFTLLETSITKGFRAGVVFDLGAIFADVIFIFIAYFSDYALHRDSPAARAEVRACLAGRCPR